jgi:hypothetical protein
MSVIHIEEQYLYINLDSPYSGLCTCEFTLANTNSLTLFQNPWGLRQSSNNKSCGKYFSLSLGFLLGFSNLPIYFFTSQEGKTVFKEI